MKYFHFAFVSVLAACTHGGEQNLEPISNQPSESHSAVSSLTADSHGAKESSPQSKSDESKHAVDHHDGNHEYFRDAKFADLNVKAHDSLFLSGQPSLLALKAMKAGNVKLYIDIRPKSEVSPEFIKMVQSQGITFISKPIFSKDGTADLKAVDEVYALHKKYHDVGHVVGCTSGARSSAWFTLHLLKHHKMPVEEAIEIGKTAYLTEALAENIRKMSK